MSMSCGNSTPDQTPRLPAEEDNESEFVRALARRRQKVDDEGEHWTKKQGEAPAPQTPTGEAVDATGRPRTWAKTAPKDEASDATIPKLNFHTARITAEGREMAQGLTELRDGLEAVRKCLQEAAVARGSLEERLQQRCDALAAGAEAEREEREAAVAALARAVEAERAEAIAREAAERAAGLAGLRGDVEAMAAVGERRTSELEERMRALVDRSVERVTTSSQQLQEAVREELREALDGRAEELQRQVEEERSARGAALGAEARSREEELRAAAERSEASLAALRDAATAALEEAVAEERARREEAERLHSEEAKAAAEELRRHADSRTERLRETLGTAMMEAGRAQDRRYDELQELIDSAVASQADLSSGLDGQREASATARREVRAELEALRAALQAEVRSAAEAEQQSRLALGDECRREMDSRLAVVESSIGVEADRLRDHFGTSLAEVGAAQERRCEELQQLVDAAHASLEELRASLETERQAGATAREEAAAAVSLQLEGLRASQTQLWEEQQSHEVVGNEWRQSVDSQLVAVQRSCEEVRASLDVEAERLGEFCTKSLAEAGVTHERRCEELRRLVDSTQASLGELRGGLEAERQAGAMVSQDALASLRAELEGLRASQAELREEQGAVGNGLRQSVDSQLDTMRRSCEEVRSSLDAEAERLRDFCKASLAEAGAEHREELQQRVESTRKSLEELRSGFEADRQAGATAREEAMDSLRAELGGLRASQTQLREEQLSREAVGGEWRQSVDSQLVAVQRSCEEVRASLDAEAERLGEFCTKSLAEADATQERRYEELQRLVDSMQASLGELRGGLEAERQAGASVSDKALASLRAELEGLRASQAELREESGEFCRKSLEEADATQERRCEELRRLVDSTQASLGELRGGLEAERQAGATVSQDALAGLRAELESLRASQAELREEAERSGEFCRKSLEEAGVTQERRCDELQRLIDAAQASLEQLRGGEAAERHAAAHDEAVGIMRAELYDLRRSQAELKDSLASVGNEWRQRLETQLSEAQRSAEEFQALLERRVEALGGSHAELLETERRARDAACGSLAEGVAAAAEAAAALRRYVDGELDRLRATSAAAGEAHAERCEGLQRSIDASEERRRAAHEALEASFAEAGGAQERRCEALTRLVETAREGLMRGLEEERAACAAAREAFGQARAEVDARGSEGERSQVGDEWRQQVDAQLALSTQLFEELREQRPLQRLEALCAEVQAAVDGERAAREGGVEELRGSIGACLDATREALDDVRHCLDRETEKWQVSLENSMQEASVSQERRCAELESALEGLRSSSAEASDRCCEELQRRIDAAMVDVSAGGAAAREELWGRVRAELDGLREALARFEAAAEEQRAGLAPVDREAVEARLLRAERLADEQRQSLEAEREARCRDLDARRAACEAVRDELRTALQRELASRPDGEELRQLLDARLAAVLDAAGGSAEAQESLRQEFGRLMVAQEELRRNVDDLVAGGTEAGPAGEQLGQRRDTGRAESPHAASASLSAELEQRVLAQVGLEVREELSSRQGEMGEALQRLEAELARCRGSQQELASALDGEREVRSTMGQELRQHLDAQFVCFAESHEELKGVVDKELASHQDRGAIAAELARLDTAEDAVAREQRSLAEAGEGMRRELAEQAQALQRSRTQLAALEAAQGRQERLAAELRHGAEEEVEALAILRRRVEELRWCDDANAEQLQSLRNEVSSRFEHFHHPVQRHTDEETLAALRADMQRSLALGLEQEQLRRMEAVEKLTRRIEGERRARESSAPASSGTSSPSGAPRIAPPPRHAGLGPPPPLFHKQPSPQGIDRDLIADILRGGAGEQFLAPRPPVRKNAGTPPVPPPAPPAEMPSLPRPEPMCGKASR